MVLDSYWYKETGEPQDLEHCVRVLSTVQSYTSSTLIVLFHDGVDEHDIRWLYEATFKSRFTLIEGENTERCPVKA